METLLLIIRESIPATIGACVGGLLVSAAISLGVLRAIENPRARKALGFVAIFALTYLVCLIGFFLYEYFVFYPQYERTRSMVTTRLVVADFDGPESQRYRVAGILRDELRTRLATYGFIDVNGITRVITEVEGDDLARETASRNDASVFVWGWYAVADSVALHFNVELLRLTEHNILPLIASDVRGQVAEAPRSSIEDYSLQTRFSTDLAAILTGMACYSAEHWDCAVQGLSDGITLVEADDSLLLLDDPGALYVLRGGALYFQGDYAAAIEDYDQALELNPRNAMAYHGRAYAHRDSGELTQALSDLDNAILYRPNYAEAYVSRAIVYSRLARWEEAIADHQRAADIDFTYGLLVRDHDLAHAYLQLGIRAVASANYDEALDRLAAAQLLDPEFADVYYWRGLVYYRLDQDDEATSDLQEYLTSGTDPSLQESAQDMLADLGGR